MVWLDGECLRDLYFFHYSDVAFASLMCALGFGLLLCVGCLPLGLSWVICNYNVKKYSSFELLVCSFFSYRFSLAERLAFW